MIHPTAGDQAIWRRALLAHTYTHVPQSSSSEDNYGEELPTPGTAVPGVACRYLVKEEARRTVDGFLTVDTPTLYVAPDDPLEEADIVQDVKALDGRVLLAGPATVEAVKPAELIGLVWAKEARLRFAEPVGA